MQQKAKYEKNSLFTSLKCTHMYVFLSDKYILKLEKILIIYFALME